MVLQANSSSSTMLETGTGNPKCGADLAGGAFKFKTGKTADTVCPGDPCKISDCFDGDEDVYKARWTDMDKCPPALEMDKWNELSLKTFGTTPTKSDRPTGTEKESVKAGARGVSLEVLKKIRDWITGATGGESGSMKNTAYRACKDATPTDRKICREPHEDAPKPGGCGAGKDADCTGYPLSLHYEVNMNILNDQLIKPLTGGGTPVSFAEWVGFDKPDTFISHNWGGSFVHFVNTADLYWKQLKEGKKTEATYYFWVCTFANNQHDVKLGDTVDESPFAAALDHAKKMIIIQDDPLAQAELDGSGAAKIWSFTLRRAWCVFEMHWALLKKYKIHIGCANGALLASDSTDKISDMKYIHGNDATKCSCQFTPLLETFDAAKKETNPSPSGVADLKKVDDWMKDYPLTAAVTDVKKANEVLTKKIKTPVKGIACMAYTNAQGKARRDRVLTWANAGATGYEQARFGLPGPQNTQRLISLWGG